MSDSSSGRCLAENGNDVVCVDKDESKIATLRRGQDADLRARASKRWSAAITA